jgi:hypothetical protein
MYVRVRVDYRNLLGVVETKKRKGAWKSKTNEIVLLQSSIREINTLPTPARLYCFHFSLHFHFRAGKFSTS